MTVYFMSNGRNLKATIDAFHFADFYLWLTIGDSVHMFNNVTSFHSETAFLASSLMHVDVSELIRSQSCARYDAEEHQDIGPSMT